MIQNIYGESAVHRAVVVRESIRNEQRSGILTTTRTCANIGRTVDILKEDRRSSCGLIA